MARRWQSQRACSSSAKVTAGLLLSFFASTSLAAIPGLSWAFPTEPNRLAAQQEPHDFTLRQIVHHGSHQYPGLYRKIDIREDSKLWQMETPDVMIPVPHYRARSQPMKIQRMGNREPEYVESLMELGREQGMPLSMPAWAWTVDTISGPNVTDKDSVVAYARIALDAYTLVPGTGDWVDPGVGFNYTEDFGWENDGLRGHVFADKENKTVIVGLKGTSPGLWGGDGDTIGRDKTNDNLFFGCCGGQGGCSLWHQASSCMGDDPFTCNTTCIQETLHKKSHYYHAAQHLYRNVTEDYPNSDIWIVGHSLGGALSSLLGLTYGVPVVTFGAAPEAMAAFRLGLPTPPDFHVGIEDGEVTTGAYHFGHTADPIFMGTCAGCNSFCSIWGYSMQSKCHTGHKCIYDAVGDLGYRSSMANHRIIITLSILEKYNTTAKCEPIGECSDCVKWKYFKSNGSEITTTRASTSTSVPYTRTRTETCKTPGWWGCLDETTTMTAITTTTANSRSVSTIPASTTATTTCESPGWFGCKDPSSTSSSSTSLSPSSTCSSTTCHHPGWFGCKDPITTTSQITAPTTSSKPTASTSTCETPGWFWCKDIPEDEIITGSTSRTMPITRAPTSTSEGSPHPTATSTCYHPGFFWGCWDNWEGAADNNVERDAL